jgi:RNA polymerase sigma-B factor
MLAMVKAARRYDPEHGAAFASYATASIVGELKRYFRDRTWSMRLPRSLQELHLTVNQPATNFASRSEPRRPWPKSPSTWT